MSYNRIATPRAYIDLISYNLAHGWSTPSNISMLQDDGSTAVTFDSGQKEDLFDLRPSNFATIEAENQAFYIQYDTEFSTDTLAESNFIAILGHNFKEAGVHFRLQHDDSALTGNPAAFPSPQAGVADSDITRTGNHTKVINAVASGTANWIEPASNGWTLITWDDNNTDNKYYGLYFAKAPGTFGTNFDADVKIGAIVIGNYIDFPHSPDMSIQTSVDYDGTKLQGSVGGNTYANTAAFGQPKWAATNPWALHTIVASTYSFNQRYGRINHNMNFSFISDTNLFAQSMHSHTASEWFDSSDLHSQFYNKILGQHNPFLFSIDKDSTTLGDYGLFRLADSGLNATQVANRTWSMGLNIVETW